MNPQAYIRSLPPKGAEISFETARQEIRMNPQAHIRSLPPKGAVTSFETARQEVA